MQNKNFQRALVCTLGRNFSRFVFSFDADPGPDFNLDLADPQISNTLIRLRISMLIQINILRFTVHNHDYNWFFLQRVQLSSSKNQSMNAFNSPFKTILMIYCREKVTIRTHRPPKMIQIQIRFRHNQADPTWSETLCEMEKNTVLWNRNDLLLFRFRLWKSLVPVPAPVLRFRSHNTGKIYTVRSARVREKERK
jgi:hypothetical protein